MNRAVVLAVACCALAASTLAPEARAAGASLTPAGDPQFPSRAWVLTLPAGVNPEADAIKLLENGKPVSDLGVSFANSGSKRFGVVLVIDTSKSMHGESIRDAMAAARAFAGQRPAQQPLGIVTFNETANVVLPPTTDDGAIDAALSKIPALHSGTRIYDATAQALQLFSGDDFQAGAVVVLSDGADTGSATKPAAIVKAARTVHTKVFSVGLRSRAYDASTLRDVAVKGSGEYLGATSGRHLAGLYRKLGGQLANAYILRYQSYGAPGSTIEVQASALGQKASAIYVVPQLQAVAGAVPPGHKGDDGPFLKSTIGILLVTLAFLGLAFVGLAALLLSRQRGFAIRNRVTDYALPTPEIEQPYGPTDAEAARGRFERSLLGAERLAALKELLDVGRIDTAPGQLVITTAVAAVLVGWIGAAVSGFFLFGLIAFGGIPMLVRMYVMSKVNKQRRLFADQLADSVQALSSAMRTGHSFASALSVLVEDAAEPAATEFRRVIADERLGVPLEEAFRDTRRRMNNSDIEQIALVAVLQRETGGNGAEALDRVVENLRARDEVRRLVWTLSAQGRMSRYVLTGLPIVLLIIFTLIGREYVDPLYHTTAGHVALAIAAILVWLGSVSIKKIVEIEV